MALTRRREHEPEVVTGVARVGRRTKDLVERIKPGEIMVVDHADLDRVAAEDIIEAQAAAVINASASMSGRYPNLGPLLLCAAGIPLVDSAGPQVMTDLPEGAVLTVVGDRVLLEGREVARGRRQSVENLEARIEESRRSLGEELERFAANTLEYLRQERHLLTDTVEIPEVDLDLRGRHVLIVVRGAGYKEDLRMLRRSGYLAEMRPVLVGVDGAADALIEIGQTPDLIIGDMDSVSEEALRCGAVLVVHGYRDGRAPGASRLAELGLDHVVWPAEGTSEDIAMLLAYERGAELIVAVGTHSSMVEFLDKGRAGMASTFLVRMKVGPILVDAKGVSRLYRQGVRKRDLAMLVLSAVFTFGVVVAISEPVRLVLRGYWLTLTS
jgi:uncharacterized membrane-anchored protein